MVFTKILFIRGIIVSAAALRVLLGRRFVEKYNEWCMVRRESKLAENEDPWTTFVLENNVCKFLSKKLLLEVYTWPYNSALNCEKFVIGIMYGRVDVCEGMLDNAITVPEIPVSTEKLITHRLAGYRDCFVAEIQSVMMLDECSLKLN